MDLIMAMALENACTWRYDSIPLFFSQLLV